ncbi:unnamed protein product [Cuscuta campestris]|uniref:Uncharacterized protein n=1 Tax=Cuscuta campestris TaxID=132261 RepID=A0A484M816_9ASTE|nr:unnamed protein product [Cuscuta campestris]
MFGVKLCVLLKLRPIPFWPKTLFSLKPTPLSQKFILVSGPFICVGRRRERDIPSRQSSSFPCAGSVVRRFRRKGSSFVVTMKGSDAVADFGKVQSKLLILNHS